MTHQQETILDVQGSRCWVVRGAFADEAFEHWQQHVSWQQNRIQVYGKEHLEPRLTAWMGPEYRYSSIAWPAQPLTAHLQSVIVRVELLIQPAQPFNACLFNLYRDGRDAMGWHRDNEPEIDPTCIASVSFGAARDFLIRHRTTGEKWSVHVQHGDLLVMERMQHDFEHALPKRLRVNTPRINLTLRRIRIN